MADKARDWTDKHLADMEKRIAKVYKEAQEDITEKWNAYMKRAEKRVDGLQSAYESALKSGNDEKISESKSALETAKKNITFQDKRYKEMINETTDNIANANKTALAYVNGQMPSIYRVNYNGVGEKAEELGFDFKRVNEHMVSNLIKDGDIQLPKKKLDIPKDKRWNTKKLNSSVLQGILQGESMDKIAKRITPIVDSNIGAAIRNARTMVTGAESRGRQDSYEDLENRGAVIRKTWIATGDARTRDWHLSMDGQTVDIHEHFTDGNGNKIRFPGDPTAAGETVYNCRCTMESDIVGVRKADGRIAYFDEYEEDSLHEKQIEAERSKREEIQQEEKDLRNTTLSLGSPPVRPKMADFENADDYYKAKELYQQEKERFKEQSENLLDNWLNAPKDIQTKNDFSVWAKNADVSVTKRFYENVDSKLYNDISSVEQEMFTRFPEVKEHQDKFHKWQLDYTNDSSYLMESTAGLNFGESFKDATITYQNVINMQTDGYLTKGDGTIATLIRHEYGHNADSYCRSKFSTLELTYQDKVSGKMDRRFEARQNYESDLKSLTMKFGSEYAKINPAEAFAEGFAEYTSNHSSDYGKAFGEFFKRWYYADDIQ